MSRHPTTIRLTTEQQRAIDEAASVQGISRSQWITNTIEAALPGVTTPVTTGDYAAELVDIERRLSALEAERQPAPPTTAGDDSAGNTLAQPTSSKPTATNGSTRPAPQGVTVPTTAAEHHKPPKGGTPPAALARLIALKDAGASHVATAAALNAEGLKRGTGITWDAAAVGVQWKREQQRRKT